MEKRYQIFLSSVCKELKDERRVLIGAMLQNQFIPSAMEFFPAADEDVFEYIKKQIDISDYYVVLIGGLYGTEDQHQRSMTEKEFDYAHSIGKKIIALVKTNPNESEIEDERIRKLTELKNKASCGRLIQYWSTKDELIARFNSSLNYAIECYPTSGWIRCVKGTCKNRLGFGEVNKNISVLQEENIRTIHIMASGTSTYPSIIQILLGTSKSAKKKKIDVFVYFRLGTDKDRISLLRNQYNNLWEKLNKEYPRINLHFICVNDFVISFRGLVVNKRIGMVGVYVRTNGETHGTLNSSIIVDNETDAGKYLIDEFLRPFEGACYYASIKNCVDKSIKHIFLNQDRGYYDD